MTEFTEHLQNCPVCQAAMDITGLEPLSRAVCPSCGETVIVSPRIAHYELIEVIGRGGMGVVYKARDLSLDRMVALKVLRKDHSQNAELVAQLETEAAITASINHPHVVRVFTTGADQGRFYIAMELVDKGTLDDLISLQGRVAEAQVLEIAVEIAQGLRAAYQHGLIHRDVKPGNILFADAHTAKIVDFGLAMLEAAASGGGEIWGTPYYVAPEKLDQKPEDLRSDIYSLGATLFHALAGRPPFEAADATMVALKHLKSQAVSLQAFAPHVSGSTAYVINRTLLKDPDQRYQNYDELIEHLEYARTELEQKGAQPQSKQRVILETEEDQKLWSYVTFGMLGVAVLLGLGGWWYLSSRSSEPYGAPSASESASTVAVGSGASAQQTKQYQAARKQLIEGKPAEAAKLFHSLGVDTKTPAPMAQWSLAHAGLAELLAGRPDEARSIFIGLESREMPTRDALETELAAFFKRLSALMSTGEPIQASAVTEFPRESYGAFAPLVLGLKDWQLSQFDDAGTLLRQYQTSSPRGEFSWISDYSTLVSDFLADFTEYRGALELVKMVKSDADERKTAERLETMSKDLRTKGKLAERIESLSKEMTARGEVRRKELAAKIAADRSIFNNALPRIVELSRAWKFSEARQALQALQITGNEVQRERNGLSRKLEWLNAWKNTLIAELPKTGAKGVLRKKDESELKGSISKATDAGLEVQGSGQIAWSDLSPASLIAAGANPTNLPPEAAGERAWLAGVFAAMSGDSVQAEKLLAAGAKAHPEYVSALPLLLPSARPSEVNLAKGAKYSASSFVKTDQYDERPEKAFDDNPKTKWCATGGGQKWLQVDLGSPKTIAAWAVHHASSGTEPAGMNTADFELQISSDGKKWENLDTVWGNSGPITKRLLIPTETRFARLFVKKAANSNESNAPARIPEFQLFGATKSNGEDVAKAFFEPSDYFPTPQLVSHDQKTNKAGLCEIDWQSGEVTLKGSGSDIYMKEDSFQFAFQRLVGDGVIIARVLEVDNTDEWTKAGLMFRESLGGGSKNAFFAVTPAGRVTLQNRSQTDGDTASSHESGNSTPIWLKLVRQGNKFTGYTSTDGVTWKERRSVTVQMQADVRVGLAFSSHKNDVLATSRFDNVQITSVLLPVSTATTANEAGPKKTAQAKDQSGSLTVSNSSAR